MDGRGSADRSLWPPHRRVAPARAVRRAARRSRAALLLALVVAVTPGPTLPAPAAEDPRVPYTLDLSVAEAPAADDLRDRLEAASTLAALADDPPATRLGVRRRLESDRAALRDVLRAEGYYAGRVEGRLGEGSPLPVTLTLRPGPRYTVSDSAVVYRDAPPDPGTLPQDLAAAGLPAGTPATSEAVLAAERALIEALRGRGHPFAKAVARRAAVNHAHRTMAVRVVVEAGSPATFGAVRYEGLERTRRSHLDGMVPWQAGSTFDARQLDTFRRRLRETRLFSAVTVRPADSPGADGRLPVEVTVTEAPPRSVGGGLRYATDDGPGARLFWEHRNLFGGGEALRVNWDAGATSQSGEVVLQVPRFRHPDQRLRLSATAERAEREAYEGLTAGLGAGVERDLGAPGGPRWTVSAGAELELAALKDRGERERSLLVGLPLGVSRDTTDDPLDPTAGTRLSLTLAPYAGRADGAPVAFAVADVVGSAYWAPLESDRLVLAARGRVAGLVGAARAAVPPNRRLYAGGGGSVRGYGHQMVGPLDADGDPLGGRSAVELGLEARIRVTEDIGLVPFVDAGLVGDGPLPDFGGPVRWAAGLGARYHTDFGPVRFDVGVPLNPRAADDRFQIYISLGQAF